MLGLYRAEERERGLYRAEREAYIDLRERERDTDTDTEREDTEKRI